MKKNDLSFVVIIVAFLILAITSPTLISCSVTKKKL